MKCRRRARRDAQLLALTVVLAAQVIVLAQPKDSDPDATERAKRSFEATLAVLSVRPQLLPPRRSSEKDFRSALVTSEVVTGEATAVSIRTSRGTANVGNWDRAVATARGALPDFWLVVTSPDGSTVESWTPVTVSKGIRVEDLDRERRAIDGRIVRRRVPRFAAHVPFVAGGRLYLAEPRPPVALQFLGAFGASP